MGQYNISTKEIVEAIEETLDRIDGDFTRSDLITAVGLIGTGYPYVSDELITDTMAKNRAIELADQLGWEIVDTIKG